MRKPKPWESDEIRRAKIAEAKNELRKALATGTLLEIEVLRHRIARLRRERHERH